jgi:hypothetical protein
MDAFALQRLERILLFPSPFLVLLVSLLDSWRD